MKTIRITCKSAIHLISISALFLSFSGCGYNPKDPVYDTASNPDNYPPAALSLLGDIETEKVVASDSISSRFADLYTTDSDLLDNPKWKEVIERLGARLSYKADSLVLLGLSHYNTVAGYYSLASFARPEDKDIALMAGQFAVWSQNISTHKESASSIIEGKATVSEKIEFLRTFWNGKDISRDFASTYLLAQLFEWPVDKEAISNETAKTLSPSDLALARVLGLTTYDSKQLLASFNLDTTDTLKKSGYHSIDLIAATVHNNSPKEYLVEAYFTANQRLDKDYTISVRAGTAGGGRMLLNSNLAFVPFEAKPFVPLRQWREGEVYAVFLRFDAPVEPSGVAIGIFETQSGQNRFLPVVGKQGSFVEITGNK